MRRATALGELARLFLRLGGTAFGGPGAHIAMMEDEVVRRRSWLTHDEFIDYLGVTSLIPGPNSTEMAMHVGWVRAGLPGLLVAGLSFILPAAGMVAAMAWAYVRFGVVAAAAPLLYGIKPVVIAVVVRALWRLAGRAVKSTWLGLLGLGAGGASLFGLNELAILAGAAVIAMAAQSRPDRRMLALLPIPLGLAGVGTPFGLGKLFLIFLKIGAVLFGSGYVLLAFLRADLVDRLHWITNQQLLDAVAVGQVTPGPLFTTATFIGYTLGGWVGAAAATVGIFTPAFAYAALSNRVVPLLRRSLVAGAALDGINVASLALMATVTLYLGRTALADWPSMVIASVSALVLFRTRLNSAWLVLGGAAAGYLIYAVR